MYVLLNGAFGVGKTTVARELRRRPQGAALFDPEWVGLLLMQHPRYNQSDFQHLVSWRRLSVIGARLCGAVRRTVILPMAFSNLSYLEEVRTGLASPDRPVLHFCLTAPLEVARSRLAERGELDANPQWTWVHRRAAECCRAHADPRFEIRVPTADATPQEVAAELAQRIEDAAQRGAANGRAA